MGITHTIVQQVADHEGIDPLELPSIYDTIDTESIEHVIKSANDTALNIRFVYFGYQIDVNGDREVKVREKDGVIDKGRQTD